LFCLGCFLMSLYHLCMVGWWYPHSTSLHGFFVIVLLSWWDVSVSYAVTRRLGMHGLSCLCWPLVMTEMVDGFVVAAIMAGVCRCLVELPLRGPFVAVCMKCRLLLLGCFGCVRLMLL
jgi:hypothetical protein